MYPDRAWREVDASEVTGLTDKNQSVRVFSHDNFISQTGNSSTIFAFVVQGTKIKAPSKGGWKTTLEGAARLDKAGRMIVIGNTPRYVRFLDDMAIYPLGNRWSDTVISGFGEDKVYVVQTLSKVIARCMLMTTDPGDLVLDPTCGSGTTAYVAEQWGRRWITIDTSRVAIALARTRLMAARYPYYLLADSPEGRRKEAEVSGHVPEASTQGEGGDIKRGFVYERVPHVTLKSIANNEEIDEIHAKYQPELEARRGQINKAAGENWEEWEIPHEAPKGARGRYGSS